MMKIDNASYSLPLAPGGEGKARASNAKPENNAPSAPASDVSVNLGSTSVQMRSATDMPPMDSSKIAEIKQAISEGRIAVNANAVAGSLIKSVTDLIASQQA